MPDIKSVFIKKRLQYIKYATAVFVLIVLSIILLQGIAYWGISRKLVNIPGNYVLKVESGNGLISIIDKLAVDGIIDNPSMLKIWYYIYGTPDNLQRGEYRITEGLRINQLILNISIGKQKLHKITISLGSTFNKFYQELISHPQINSVTENMTVADIMNLVSSNYHNPEGLFYADTYFFYAGEEDLTILKKANRQLITILNEEWDNRQDKLVYKNPYEALIMASIIEKETALDEERPLISGVFHHRLSIGMRLQTDPTVIYGMGDKYKGNIGRSDLRNYTPYNTYVIYGLPPTPISFVDRRAINAAVNPIDTEYLFFVAKADGSRSHYFSKTLKEHNKAVRKYQLGK